MTKLTDGQIAQILSAVDDGEIEQAKLAPEKSSEPRVRGSVLTAMAPRAMRSALAWTVP